MSQVCPALETPDSSTGAIALEQQFQASPYSGLRQLTCAAAGGRIVLRGTVPCYYLKQIAQTLAVKTVGAGRIESNIEVESQ